MPDIDWYAALLAHAAAHPQATIQDWVKFVFQATFGGGHLIRAPAEVVSSIGRETRSLLAQTEQSAGRVLCEPLGEGWCRLDVVAAHAMGVNARAVARLFAAAARTPHGETTVYRQRLERVCQACRAGELACSAEQAAAFVAAHAAQGYPAIGHSARYREAYHPAYRVVRQAHVPYLEAVQAIEQRLQRATRERLPLLIAIEGPCGSGKSTLADILQTLYGDRAAVIRMDDFFLPPALQTAARFATPGGNIHHERFGEEVAGPLRTGGAFAHRVYDCAIRAYAEKTVRIVPDQLVVIEGVYSMHPRIDIAYDLAIFVRVSPAEQARRVRQRSGEALWQRFVTEWIPMENRYFEAYAIREQCDLVLDADEEANT